MSRTPHEIQTPVDPTKLGGPFVPARALILAEKNGRGIAELDELETDDLEWICEGDFVYFQRLRDDVTLKALRHATEADLRQFRVPIWIQGEEVPDCCGRPMHFVGQLDDSQICAEPPPDARMWWHDAASFYVFTCPLCLGVKAVGQQF